MVFSHQIKNVSFIRATRPNKNLVKFSRSFADGGIVTPNIFFLAGDNTVKMQSIQRFLRHKGVLLSQVAKKKDFLQIIEGQFS